MSPSLVRRAAVLFVLCVLLVAPWSAAAPRQDHTAPSPPLLGQLWSRLTTLWSNIGCIMDPGGSCRGGAATQGDIGCVIDPGGSCRGAAGTQGDIGCGADPGGICRGAAAPQGDIGCGIDPHGCGR